jgi:hypothetical protein
MTRQALLKRLDSMLATAETERMWGNFEIEIRDGQPTVLRKQTSERLQERDITRDQTYRR